MICLKGGWGRLVRSDRQLGERTDLPKKEKVRRVRLGIKKSISS